MKILPILLAVVLNTYGQLILKWRISLVSFDTHTKKGFILLIVKLFFTPWVISGYIAVFLAALVWMVILTRMDISFAYPFMGLSFVLIFIAGACLFNEPVTTPKIIGTVFITIGVVFMSQGA